MMRSSTPILPTSWRRAERRTLRDLVGGQAHLPRDRGGVARDALGVAAGVRDPWRRSRRRARGSRTGRAPGSRARPSGPSRRRRGSTSLIRLKFSERSAISAVPATSTVAPYLPFADRAGRLRELGDRPRQAAGEEETEERARRPRQIALQTTVSRTIRSTEANAMSRSRSTRTPQRRLADRRDRRQDGARRARLGPRQPRREADEVRDEASTGAAGPCPRTRAERGSCPARSTSVARTSRRASSSNSRRIGCQETRASTTPIRLPFSSMTGLRQDRHRSRALTTAKGSPAYRTPSPGRLEALPELEVHVRRRGRPGRRSCPRPSRLTPRIAASCVWRGEDRCRGSRARRWNRTGPCP